MHVTMALRGETVASRTTTIDDTEFYLSGDGTYVGECGTTRRWNPDNPEGYQMHSRDGWHTQKISLLAFEGFGCYPRNLENRDHWCEKARKAWNELHG